MKASPTSGFILIVDDNSTNLSLLSMVLNSAGLDFRVAVDGESALAIAARNGPEMILLDVKMPGIDGFETCRRLKGNPKTRGIPVIFTTASTDTDSKAKGFALGAVDYIPKPFEPAEVLARVQVHLQLRRLTESLEDQVRDRTAALQQAQVRLVQQEKLSTLGEMMAGVAHEINNPINFIANNVQLLNGYITDITDILRGYQREYPEPSARLMKQISALDLDFALKDTHGILQSLVVGADRIIEISKSLRTFARADQEIKTAVDLHDCLNTTLMILQHRFKGSSSHPEIEVTKTYGSPAKTLCYPGQMSQVFMNILANAVDAIEETYLMKKNDTWIPKIDITTQTVENQKITFHITDNGMGIADDIKLRLFEPLFTTKPVGKGTGLGLAIARQIVFEKHNGSLSFASQAGAGATFIVEIPIEKAGP